jgi:hypothetical protein
MAYILLPLAYAAKVRAINTPPTLLRERPKRVKRFTKQQLKQSNAIRRIEPYEIKTRIYLA